MKIILNIFYPPTQELMELIETNQKNNGVFYPINGGSTLDDEWSNLFLKKDCVGDNISNYNSLLNEMTSIYWFWKNEKLPEYIGFNHYRRFFKSEDIEKSSDYDITVSKPIWSSMSISLAHQYKYYHKLEDLQKCIDIIRNEFNYEWGEGFRKYLLNNGINLAPCNMFIMKKDLFEEWCSFIFPLLFRLKTEICDTDEFKQRDNYQKRALCFLTERIFNYWYFLKKKSGIKTNEVDIVERLEYKPFGINERGDYTSHLPKVALVAIAKNEDEYLKEWVDYNLKVGFSEIFVYQNDWRYTKNDITNPHVHLEILDGPQKQNQCYNDFIKNHYNEYDFIAFFDIDEFIYIKNNKSVPEFLNDYKDVDALYINWRLFGDNGLKCVENDDYSVLNRFTKCDDKLHRLGKPILNTKRLGTSVLFNNPHLLVYSNVPNKEFKPCDPLRIRQVNFGNIPDNDLDEPCELYHYRNKTWEETLKRRFNTTDAFWDMSFKSRSDLDTIKMDFENHNKNVIDNLNITTQIEEQ